MSLAIRRHLSATSRQIVRATATGFAALTVLTGAAGAGSADETGLIDDERYESPNFGYEVEWDRPWDVQPAGTASEDGFDSLKLCHAETCLAVNGIETELTPATAVDLFVEDYESDFLSDFDLIEQDREDGVVYATFSGEIGNSRWVVHVEIRELDETTDDQTALLLSFLVSPAGDYEDLVESAGDDIEVDGEPNFLFAETDQNDDRDHD